jgi:hypothetical protein
MRLQEEFDRLREQVFRVDIRERGDVTGAGVGNHADRLKPSTSSANRRPGSAGILVMAAGA